MCINKYNTVKNRALRECKVLGASKVGSNVSK